MRKGITKKEQDELFAASPRGEISKYRIPPGVTTRAPVVGVSMCTRVDAKGKPTGDAEGGLKLIATILLRSDGDAARANKMRVGELEKICGETGMRQDEDGYFVGLAPSDFFIKTARDFFGDASDVRRALKCAYTIADSVKDKSIIPLTERQEKILASPPGTPLPRESAESAPEPEPEPPADDAADGGGKPPRRDPAADVDAADLKEFFDARMVPVPGAQEGMRLIEFAAKYYGVPAGELDEAAVAYKMVEVFTREGGPFEENGIPSIQTGLGMIWHWDYSGDRQDPAEFETKSPLD